MAPANVAQQDGESSGFGNKRSPCRACRAQGGKPPSARNKRHVAQDVHLPVMIMAHIKMRARAVPMK